MLEAIILVVFPFCMAFSVLSDLTSMTIANRVSVVLAVTFLVVAPLAGIPWALIAWHALAAAVVLAVTFGFFAAGWIGGGDAKLMAASALWLGFGPNLVAYILISSVLGGLLSLLIMRYRNSPVSVVTGNNMFLNHLASHKVGVPYGVALGLAGLIVYPDTPLMVWAMERIAVAS